MEHPADPIERIKARCDKVERASEGGVTFFVLTALRLPAGATPPVVDALLRIGDRGDNYPTRLYLAQLAVGASRIALNWNARDVHVLGRNWHAFSWKAAADLPLDEVLEEHLRGLQ